MKILLLAVLTLVSVKPIAYGAQVSGASYSVANPLAVSFIAPCQAGKVVGSSDGVTTSCVNPPGGVSTVGTFSGSSQTNGASISGSAITFGPADATNPGMVSTGTQTFAGNKTFNGLTSQVGTISSAAGQTGNRINITSTGSGSGYLAGTYTSLMSGGTTSSIAAGTISYTNAVTDAGSIGAADWYTGTGTNEGIRAQARAAGANTMNIGVTADAIGDSPTTVGISTATYSNLDSPSHKSSGGIFSVVFPSSAPNFFTGTGIVGRLNTDPSSMTPASAVPAFNSAVVGDVGNITNADFFTGTKGAAQIFRIKNDGTINTPGQIVSTLTLPPTMRGVLDLGNFGTLPLSVTGASDVRNALLAFFSSSGTSDGQINGGNFQINAGYTGPGTTVTLQGNNQTSPTGGDRNWNHFGNGNGLNGAVIGQSAGGYNTTSGGNIAVYGQALPTGFTVGTMGQAGPVGTGQNFTDVSGVKGYGAVGLVTFPSAAPSNFKGTAVLGKLGTTDAATPSDLPGVNAAIVGDVGNVTGADIFTGIKSGTQVFRVKNDGSVAAGSAQSVVSCSTSGTVTYSQPYQGSSYKKVVAYLNACNGTAAYTFPTAFTNTGDKQGAKSATVTALSTTAMTITGATDTGWLFIEGY